MVIKTGASTRLNHKRCYLSQVGIIKLICTSIYTDGQAGRIEIKIAKLEWQALDANVMVVVRGKALLVRLDQPGVGATTFERLGNNQNQNIF